MPSVRGTDRLGVASLLAATSATTGGLVGLAAGAAWRALLGAELNLPALVVLVGSCLALDIVGVQPFSTLRQVPQLWGRIFSARTVAVLYGARLGVGPLTILRTWLWWAALLAGASAGPLWSAVVGSVFGLVRIVVMLATGTRAGRLQGAERTAASATGLVLVVIVGLVGFGVDTSTPAVARVLPATSSFGRSVEAPTPSVRPTADTSVEASVVVPPTTTPPTVNAEALALPDTLLSGWTRAADDAARGLGPLDLDGAAAAEQDATAERSLLETRRFVSGRSRGWRGPQGQVGYASVYRFASPSDAAAYLLDGVTTLEARGARIYDVASPAGGRGFSQVERSGPDAGSAVSHGVVFVRDARFFLTFVTGRDSSVDPGDAVAAAQSVASVAGG